MKAKLFYNTTDASADMRYALGLPVSDPMVVVDTGRKRIGIANALEITHLRSDSLLTHVLALEDVQKATKSNEPAKHIAYVAKQFGITQWVVGPAFPAWLYNQLRGVKKEAQQCSVYPARAVKTAAEIEGLRAANKASAAGIARAGQLLRAASISKNSTLRYKGKPLTSEMVRAEIIAACAQHGALAKDTIVAGGVQGADPHEHGHGVLRAHELIVVDCFPLHEKSGMYGDMTRTFLKGTPSPAQRKLVATVRAAHKASLESIRPGVAAKMVDGAARSLISGKGFVTQQRACGTHVGFFHGTGHGLGLDLHEAHIRINASATAKLKAGNTFTVEPGLYYPEIGGCRIEDSVVVTKNGYDLLSKCSYQWHLK